MNVRLTLAALWLPERIKRRKLAQLLHLTAHAFGAAPPDLTDRSFAEGLRSYAAFTNEQAELACAGDGGAAAARLRSAARAFGGQVRDDFRLSSPRDAMKAARLLYRALGIDFRGRADGGIVIRRCYFADWYTPRVCALMSAMSEGVLAGLAGGGRLEFTGRITESCGRCAATFHFEPDRA